MTALAAFGAGFVVGVVVVMVMAALLVGGEE